MKGKFILLCTPHFDETDTTESAAASFIVNTYMFILVVIYVVTKQVTRSESGNYTTKFTH